MKRVKCISAVQMTDFQNKLSELERSQSELVAENASLKSLCRHLNEQQRRSLAADITEVTTSRDSGDGSSGSSLSVDKLEPTVNEGGTSLAMDDRKPVPQQLTESNSRLSAFQVILLYKQTLCVQCTVAYVENALTFLPMLRHCWFVCMKGIKPVKITWRSKGLCGCLCLGLIEKI